MIVSVFFAASFYYAAKIRQAASAQRVIDELEGIAAAGNRYYSEHGAWPVNLTDLCPGYLVQQASGFNPFGNAYTITSNVLSFSVSTLLPKGLMTNKSYGSEIVIVNQGNNDLVSITNPLESGTWKLRYEKKYLYKQ